MAVKGRAWRSESRISLSAGRKGWTIHSEAAIALSKGADGVVICAGSSIIAKDDGVDDLFSIKGGILLKGRQWNWGVGSRVVKICKGINRGA